MIKCKLCEQELCKGENCFGIPFEYYICCPCLEQLSPRERDAHIRRGVVPVTRSIMNPKWIEYCAQFGMRP